MTKKTYSKLDRVQNYDHAKAEELAQAIMEIKEVRDRYEYLNGLIEDNRDMRDFVWTTQEGVSKALHDLEDDHLKNIITYLGSRPGDKKTVVIMRSEAARRQLELAPTTVESEEDDNFF